MRPDNNLILDIETTSPDASSCKMRLWGVLNIRTNEIHMGTDARELQKHINSAYCLIGHNLKGFDIPVLERHGVVIDRKVIIDTWEVLAPRPLSPNAPPGKGRAAIIGELRINGMVDNRFPNLKLGTIVEHLAHVFKGRYSFENMKGDYDYDKLKGVLSAKDWIELKEYLRGDLLATRDLFLYLDDYFQGFKEYLTPVSVRKYHHITASTASLIYKAICQYLGKEETYGEKEAINRPGAFVLTPTGESFRGFGFCCDFASQHPHHQWSANLFTPASEEEIKQGKYYSGDGEIFKLDGKYSLKGMGPIEKFIRGLYFRRLFYKRQAVLRGGEIKWYGKLNIGDIILDISPTNDLTEIEINEQNLLKYRKLAEQGVDAREYTVKILINAAYGASYSPVFQHIFTPTTGRDTINMSVQSSKFMKEWMEKAGYNIVYGDTDSIYLFDPYNDKERMTKYIAEGIAKIKAVLPFVDDTYNMTIDDEFKSIFFFKNPDFNNFKKATDDIHDREDPLYNTNNVYLKKTYMYITHGDKLKMKGGKLIKSDATLLSKKVFTKYLYEPIIKNEDVKFPKDYLRRLIETELRNDITIVGRKINCKPAEYYKLPSQLQAQLSTKYGPGVHLVVKNSVRGVGASKDKYCLAHEAKTLPLSTINLKKSWSELSQFIKEETKQEKLEGWF